MKRRHTPVMVSCNSTKDVVVTGRPRGQVNLLASRSTIDNERCRAEHCAAAVSASLASDVYSQLLSVLRHWLA